MGQKSSPTGLRLGIVKEHHSLWYTGKKNFPDRLKKDFMIREYINKNYASAGIGRIKIEYRDEMLLIIVNCLSPGAIIGRKGNNIELIRLHVFKLIGMWVNIDIKKIVRFETCSKLVADSIVKQIVKRVSYKKAAKKAIKSVMRESTIKGIKVKISGRLGGAEIARSEEMREGRIPLHTFRADIDYAIEEALTTYGIIGVKVWLYKGEII